MVVIAPVPLEGVGETVGTSQWGSLSYKLITGERPWSLGLCVWRAGGGGLMLSVVLKEARNPSKPLYPLLLLFFPNPFLSSHLSLCLCLLVSVSLLLPFDTLPHFYDPLPSSLTH